MRNNLNTLFIIITVITISSCKSSINESIKMKMNPVLSDGFWLLQDDNQRIWYLFSSNGHFYRGIFSLNYNALDSISKGSYELLDSSSEGELMKIKLFYYSNSDSIPRNLLTLSQIKILQSDGVYFYYLKSTFSDTVKEDLIFSHEAYDNRDKIQRFKEEFDLLKE